jgi:hypothetical protein
MLVLLIHILAGEPTYYSRGCFISYAAAIKKAAKHSVIGAGRIPLSRTETQKKVLIIGLRRGGQENIKLRWEGTNRCRAFFIA